MKVTYTVTEVTVAFDSQGGTPVASQTIPSGTAATEPPDPTRAGFTFNGWYDAATGGNLWDFNTPVTSSETLYAKWSTVPQLSIADATVVEGGPGASPAMEFLVSLDRPAPEGGVSFHVGTTGTGSADPDVDYRTFGRQVIIPAGASTYTFADVTVIGDLDVEPDESFEVALSPAADVSAPSPVEIADGSATGKIVNDDQVIPVTQVTVTFDSQGGSAVVSQLVDSGTSATEPAEPTRAGYTFEGWYDAPSGGSLYNFDTPVTSSRTLYARWEAVAPVPQQATVTFDSNGGSAVADQSVQVAELATQPGDPTRAGHVFYGWYDAPVGGQLWNFASDEVSEDVTLYAQWTGVTLSATKVPQGGSLTVTGTGFWPGEKVRAVLHSDPLWIGTKVADKTGKVVFTTTVPVDFGTGEHRATLTGLRTDRTASAGFTVTGSDNGGALPASGGGAGVGTASGLPEVLLAGLLGLFVLLWPRRRSARS